MENGLLEMEDAQFARLTKDLEKTKEVALDPNVAREKSHRETEVAKAVHHINIEPLVWRLAPPHPADTAKSLPSLVTASLVHSLN